MPASGLWLKHDAHFGEHPKTLRMRRLAGRNADAAEVGWWRIVEAAKRYGEWTFEDDEHLQHVAGRYAVYIPIYRLVGFLDDLTIHNGSEYQTPMTGAERVAKHRASNAPRVTSVTPRAEQSTEEQKEQTPRDPADIYWQLTAKYPAGTTLEWIDDITAKYGADAVIRHLTAAHIEDRSTKTLLGRTTDLLRAEARQLDRKEAATEQAALREKRSQPRRLEPWQAEFRAAVEQQYRDLEAS